MYDSRRHKSSSSSSSSSQSQNQLRRGPPPPPPHPRRRSWCCSFTVPPRSPQNPAHSSTSHRLNKLSLKSDNKSAPSLPNSPQSNKLGGLVGRIDPRRILSPGRVSPIDDPIPPQQQEEEAEAEAETEAEDETLPSPIGHVQPILPTSSKGSSCSCSGGEGGSAIFDVRLNLKGKYGGSVVLELNSEVLSANSSVFAQLIADYRRGSSSSSAVNFLCRIEVPEVENLNVFRETIELMFQEDITKQLLRIGPYRSIDILEVAAGINFTKGVVSCLKYLEAVPWSEEEEEKLRRLFTKFNFDDTSTRDIFARLYSTNEVDSSQALARQLVWCITCSTDANARTELKSLVKGILLKSSVYEKDYPDLTKEDVYAVCESCLSQLVSLFEEASGNNPPGDLAKKETGKSLIERVSKQVDNINWLLEILLNWQMADEFVDVWAAQRELLSLHENASPMVRYELSRVSAMLFIAMGTRKLHCRGESRLRLLQAWLGPMLLDFGWLQRCRKGLDVRALEEAIGQALLTLPLKQQYMLFMDWFRCFSKHGTECPNLSKAFQIWWRRSFLAGSESSAIESR